MGRLGGWRHAFYGAKSGYDLISSARQKIPPSMLLLFLKEQSGWQSGGGWVRNDNKQIWYHILIKKVGD